MQKINFSPSLTSIIADPAKRGAAISKKLLSFSSKIFKNPNLKDLFKTLLNHLKWFIKEMQAFLFFLNIYFKDKIFAFSSTFEGNKNIVVKAVLIKRGKTNRFFLHAISMLVLTFAALISPIISESNPFSEDQATLAFGHEITPDSLTSQDVFETQASDKPRDKIIIYTVQKGDTISIIGKKFQISEDTIKWANGLKNDNINIGDELKILPVTGMAHKVERGDTVYSIAKKYQANPQEIVDFPFNDFANPQAFSLVEGQSLIVPNGVKPAEKPTFVRQTYIATGPLNISAGGFTWPSHGVVSQFYSWYHRALDIAAPIGTPIVAAQDGKVAEVYNGGWNGGYGIHTIIAGNNGYSTLYSHMSATNVSPGDTVSAGKTVLGWIGMSGRTTGPHVHFEIRGSGNFFNPLSFLK